MLFFVPLTLSLPESNLESINVLEPVSVDETLVSDHSNAVLSSGTVCF